MSVGRWVLVGIGIALAALLAYEFPSLRRYLKIERM